MRKYIVIGLSVFLSAAIWANSVLDKSEVSYNADTIVMKVGNQEINVSEVMIHFMLWRNMIEGKWGTSMWNARTGTDKNGLAITYEDDLKSDIAEELEVEKALRQEAEEKHIALTKKEKKYCRNRAEETIREFSNEEVIEYGITVDKLSEHYEDIQLVSKFCADYIDGIEEKYKQSDYNMMTLHLILFSTAKTDANGNQMEMNKEEKERVKKKANEALDQIKNGKSLDKVAKEYRLDYNTEQTFQTSGKEADIAKWNQFKHMKDGEVSDVITTSQGYFIVQMVHRDDQEKCREAWERAIRKAKEEEIIKIYREKYKDDYRTRIEEEIWEALPLASGDE
ncbi:MAG: peptidyl-prolyl cis-trans isomerase [Lachnospiraceae bacterium]|nr:peptidyl-prolyl cis-trans isomerase [Lachnospiraceae bacterium]